jgi:hypothetical protein
MVVAHLCQSTFASAAPRAMPDKIVDALRDRIAWLGSMVSGDPRELYYL